MDDETRKQITDVNEDYVYGWFKESGFSGEKLDANDGKQGKSADWKFTKQDLVVLCEVKTIFSGGQWGVTSEQYERHRLEAKQKLDHAREQAVAEGTKLPTTQEYLDYVDSKMPYRKQNIRKEEEFNKFLADVRGQLEGDESINYLPFFMQININPIYIAYGEERQTFVEWLKGLVIRTHPNYNSERIHSFTFRPRRADPQSEIKVSMQMFKLRSGSLKVSFLKGGGTYHEGKIADTIDEAHTQLQASMSKIKASTVLPVVALWSGGSSLNFLMLLMCDFTRVQMGDLPERYYLFDWAFSEYPELASIILFELRSNGDFWNPSSNDRVFPVGFVITNPNLLHVEKALKATITNNCVFIPGIASDPLNDMQDQG